MATKILPFLMGVLLVACTPAGPQVDVEAERSAVLATDRAWSETPPDLDAFVSNFTPDGASLSGNAPAAEGIEAIRSSNQELFEAPGFALSWSPSRADVSACGDLAYTVGSYEITSNDSAGNAQTQPGKYLTVWKKQADGSWKVVVDAPSENAPPPPPGTTASDTAAVRAWTGRFVTAWNAADNATFSPMIAEDAILMQPDGSLQQGRAAIVATMAEGYDIAMIQQTAAVDEVIVIGDHAYARGTWNLSPTPAAGADVQATNGKWSTLYKRGVGDAWQLSRWIWNQDAGSAEAGG